MKKIQVLALSLLLAGACTTSVQPAGNNNQPAATAPPAGTPNSEQQGSAFTISTRAYYQATINSQNSPGRVISLSLTPEFGAEMVTDFLNNSVPTHNNGKWKTL